MNTAHDTAVQGLDPEDIRVGATIAAMRVMRGFTQDALATHRKVLISRAYLANIERGRKHCTPRVAARIASAIGVDPIAIVRPDLLHRTQEPDAA